MTSPYRVCIFSASLLLAGLHFDRMAIGDVNWPQFRGPEGSGVADKEHPPVQFGQNSNLVWRTEIAPGASSPCLSGDWIFLTEFADGKLVTTGIRRRDGKVQWRQTAPAEKLEAFHPAEGSPASATPATDGDRVYVYFGSFGLLCYDLQGKEQWRYPLPIPHQVGDFGSGCSPVVAGGVVVLNRDQSNDSELLALDGRTGKIVWRTPRPECRSSFGTPVVWSHGEDREVVMPGWFQMKAYDLRTGTERWRVQGLPAAVCTTPVVGEDLLFFAGWSPGGADAPMPTFASIIEKADKNKDGVLAYEEADQGMKSFFASYDTNHDGKITKEEWDEVLSLLAKGRNVLLAVRPGGKGDISGSHVAWSQTRGLPYVASPLYYRGRVYLVKDGGMVSSFSAKTGESVFLQERVGVIGNYYASPVAADGRVYISSLTGTIIVIGTGDQLEVLAKNELGERLMATPAIADNRLYVRTEKQLYAFGK